MKIERMSLNSNKNEIKKRKECQNNFAMSKFGLSQIQKGDLVKDTVSFGAPVKNIHIHGENRLITMRHDIFKDFAKVAKKLSESTKKLFQNVDTQGRSFIDAFDELDESERKKVPSFKITNMINFNDDKIVSVKTLDDKTYTAIVRPNNSSNKVSEVISEPLNIEFPYILEDLGVRIQKLSKNAFDLSEDFMVLNTTSKLLDPDDETDLVVTKEGGFVETENAGYLIQDINDMKLPFVAHIDDVTYAKQINDELLQVYKIRDDRELSNFMMNIMLHEIIPYTNKDTFDLAQTKNAIRLVENIEQVAKHRIETGSNPALFSNVFELKDVVHTELEKKYIKEFLNLTKTGNKIILDTTQWDEKKYSEFQNLDEKALNIVFEDITDIKGNFIITKKNINLPSLEKLDGTMKVLDDSHIKAPKLIVIKNNLIIKNSQVEMPNLEQVNIIRRDVNSKAKIPAYVEGDALYREFKVTDNTLTINPGQTNKLLKNRSSEQLNLLFKNIRTIYNDFTIDEHENLKFPSLETVYGSLIIRNAENISFPKLNLIKENLTIENSEHIDLSSLANVDSDYIEENSDTIYMKHTLRNKLNKSHEEKKEKEFAQRRIAPIIDSGMSLEQQRLQFEKEIALEKLYTERAHSERMDKLKEKKAIMRNAHLERQDQLQKDYLGIMDKHLTNFENLEQKKLEYNERIEKAKLEIEDAHFRINKRLEELAITSEERKQALFIECQNRLIEQEMRNTEKWIELAYAKLEEEREEHQNEMKLQLLQIQNEYRLKVEEYKQIQNQQILQIEDAKKSRNFLQITGDYIAENGGYWGTFKHIGSKVADKISNGIEKVVNIFK